MYTHQQVRLRYPPPLSSNSLSHDILLSILSCFDCSAVLSSHVLPVGCRDARSISAAAPTSTPPHSHAANATHTAHPHTANTAHTDHLWQGHGIPLSCVLISAHTHAHTHTYTHTHTRARPTEAIPIHPPPRALNCLQQTHMCTHTRTHAHAHTHGCCWLGENRGKGRQLSGTSASRSKREQQGGEVLADRGVGEVQRGAWEEELRQRTLLVPPPLTHTQTHSLPYTHTYKHPHTHKRVHAHAHTRTHAHTHTHT